MQFHPQGAFSQDERRDIEAYLERSLRGEIGYYPFGEIHARTHVIACANRHGRTIKIKGSLHVVFDFDVRRPLPKSTQPPVLKIKSPAL